MLRCCVEYILQHIHNSKNHPIKPLENRKQQIHGIDLSRSAASDNYANTFDCWEENVTEHHFRVTASKSCKRFP